MRAAVSIPVTVKHRIGIDDRDAYEDMLAFVEVVAQAGADRFSVHARKAWLNGLSPRENRTIPPLRYDEVHRLKREHPELAIEINGGIKTMAEAKLQLEHVDAVMIGRAACDDPWVFAEADTRIFGAAANPAQTRSEAALAVVPYLAREVANGTKPHAVTRHLLGLFAKTPLAKAWKHGIASIGQMKDAEAQRAPAALEALALAASRPREERLASQASTRG
jgi:tRNA-dihydrouridine synthase A